MMHKLNRILYFWTFILVAGFYPALADARALTENIILDTDLRVQGAGVRNGDLGTSGSDDVGAAALEAKFRLLGNFGPNFQFFWEGRGVGSIGDAGFQSVDTGSISDGDSFLEWRQSYIQLKGDSPASLKFGRQKVAESYGVWWNQNFDAMRLAYDTTLFRGFVAAGENMFSYRSGDGDFTHNDQDLFRVLGEGSWQYYYDQFFEARFLTQDDHSGISVGDPVNISDPDDREGRAYWGGLRAAGKIPFFLTKGAKPSYRVDLMALRGDEDIATVAGGVIAAINSQDIKGWGFDAATDIPLANFGPILHFGYAFGTGDDNPADGTDNGFRQSGLEGNFSRIGVLSQNTDNYGTVLRPQLSNLHVLTAGFTMPVMTASDVGILYRYYRLDEPVASLPESGIFNTLNGTSRDLGQGVDFLFNMDLMKERKMAPGQIQELALRTSVGVFRSGSAFGTADGEFAARGLIELKIGF